MKKHYIIVFLLVCIFCTYYILNIDKSKIVDANLANTEKQQISAQNDDLDSSVIQQDSSDLSITAEVDHVNENTQNEQVRPSNNDIVAEPILLQKKEQLDLVIQKENAQVQKLMKEYDQDLSDEAVKQELSNEITSNQSYREAIVEKFKIEKQLNEANEK